MDDRKAVIVCLCFYLSNFFLLRRNLSRSYRTVPKQSFPGLIFRICSNKYPFFRGSLSSLFSSPKVLQELLPQIVAPNKKDGKKAKQQAWNKIKKILANSNFYSPKKHVICGFCVIKLINYQNSAVISLVGLSGKAGRPYPSKVL